MKLTKKKVREMLEDFKIDLHINTVLEKHKVSPYDFFTYIEEDDTLLSEYKKIEEFNYRYLESIVASKAYSIDPGQGAQLELIRFNNKKKFIVKDIEDEEDKVFENLSEDDLRRRIRELQDSIDKYDT